MKKIYYSSVLVMSILVFMIYNLIISYDRNKYKLRSIKSSYKYFDSDFIIQPSTVCHKQMSLLILVTSYVGHTNLRDAHRKAMPTDLLESLNMRRIFLLAKIPDSERYVTQGFIHNESVSNGDILQGSFVENYRNLTHKHLMGLNWVASVCNRTTYVLKVDDDIVFNLEKTYDFISKLTNVDRNSFLLGYILHNTIPKRNKENKWYVTWDEYPITTYPPYLSGWYYITTPELAARICKEVRFHPYFWIDDIFITGIVRESLGVTLEEFPQNYLLEYYELVECCLKDMIEKQISCEYIVGPNGGRNNLIIEFNDGFKVCKQVRCKKRPSEKPLNKVCVAFKERSIFSEGKAELITVNL